MVFRPCTFGKYALLKRIAIGGMAEVFRVMAFGAEGFEKRMAVKRMLPHLSNDSQFVDMFINEARLAAKLNHSNIVQIYDFGCIDNLYYISMEYVHGKDIADIIRMLRQRDLGAPLELACHIMIELLNGLDYAHRLCDWYGSALDLVHRDVSPHNIIISYEGEVKLVDFGIAKATSSTVQTSGGVLKGKYSYMSPEQAMGKPLNRTTDVFSLGICFYELLTLSKMFQAESDLAVLEMVRDARFTPPRELNEGIPKEVEDVLLRALAKSPADRFANASEMRDELEHFLFKKNLRFSTSWLSGFMREVFREDLDQELSEFATEAGVIEELYFEARRAAQGDQTSGGGDTVVIRRANEMHPALVVETSSLLREPPRLEREPIEEQHTFQPPTEQSHASTELEHGLEDDLADEEDVSLLQTTLVPHPGPLIYGGAGGEGPGEISSPGPIWQEGVKESSLTIQMEERKPTPALVEVLPESDRPELPLSPDEFGSGFNSGSDQVSEASWLPDAPPIDLRAMSAGKWTRSQLFWAGFFVLCVGIVGIFLWVLQGSREKGAEGISDVAPTAPRGDSEDPASRPGSDQPPPKAAPSASGAVGEPRSGDKPGDRAGTSPPDKPADRAAEKVSDRGRERQSDKAGDKNAEESGSGNAGADSRSAGRGDSAREDAEADGGQKTVSKPTRTSDRRTRRTPKVARRPSPKEEGGVGYLDVGIAGSWAYVYIDGVKIKTTPLLNHRVKAGRHKVELKDGEGQVVHRWPSVVVENNDRIKLLHQ